MQLGKHPTFVFLNKWNRPLQAWSIEDALNKVRKKCPELPRFTCHALRHSFTNNSFRVGMKMEDVKVLLGHEQLSTTVDLYGHMEAAHLKVNTPYPEFDL